MAGLFSSSTEGKHLFYKTDAEIELMREANLIVSKTLALVAGMLKPGVTGLQIDKAAEEFIRDHQGRPAFKGYHGFPASLCVSYNDIVVHGIPGNREFQEKDVVSVDCGVELNGYFGDAAFTFAMADVEEPVMELLRVTYASLYKGIEQAVAGKRIGDISFAIQHYCEREHSYGVVRELVGHGIGRSLHEDPEVPNYGKRGKGPLLQNGMVVAIEPMINLGVKEVYQASDGWTIHTRDRKPSAHYEHSVAVRKGKADVLSNHQFILDEIKNNPSLKEVSPKS
ncbi:MAG TPA: type I methionyl aminopeptidase [Ferruginibacter sp.]|nr:type I methionyl aminopeptidase [Ferruginibacter sp.]HNG63300.1 type I methionyl aminopeptidase [Ferruginibacter sp.]HNH21225.1 type I methionyl aminopeptidase [Ferruginibacter sp.]